MPSDSNIGNLPPSPIDNDDLWLINRDDKSYKVNSLQLGGYLVQIEIPKLCEDDSDCPSGTICVDNFCTRIPCDADKDCPADHICFGGYCYPLCDITTGDPCSEGFVCVDPGNTEGRPICLPYPFPCDDENLPGDGCPPGYICWGGYCWHTCAGSNGDCPPGMICVESNAPGIGFICVYPEGGFPCADGACPDGFDCFFGMCFARCDNPGVGGCGEGFVCVETSPGNFHCVPYPFPCDLYGDGCPPGMICYNGECYPDCGPGGTGGICEDGFNCIEIDGGHSICYPTDPKEKFINDGPLVIRTEPVNYPDDPAQEKIIFTANQFGRSVLTFQGFALNPGGPGGGVCDIDTDCPPGYTCVGGVCVLLPCQGNGDCPVGLVCFNGFCFPTCSADRDCPTGYECVDGICLPGGVHPIGQCDVDGDCPLGYVCSNGYCIPKQCANDGQCPAGFVCYNGYCYKECNAIIGCPPNHVCVEVTPGNFICMPIGGGPDGGGSGGDININIDPDWWDPENPMSPIGDGALKFPGDGVTVGQTYTANQKDDLTLTLEGMGIGNGKLTFPGNQTFTANQATNDDVVLTLSGMGVGDGTLTLPGNGKFTANQSGNTTLTAAQVGINDGKLQFKNNSGTVFKTFTANQSGNVTIDSSDISDMLPPLDPGLWKDTGSNNIMPKLANKNVLPNGNNTSSLGNSSNRWSNIFTNDLHLSNEGHKNDVDGTWGSYTIQEGEDDLFLINKRTGKKYRFLLDEVK